MKTIHKYMIPSKYEPGEIIEFSMPSGAEFLSIQMQNYHDMPVMWFLVDPAQKSETRRFFYVATGQKISNTPHAYLGTFQAGDYVGHVFHIPRSI